MTPPDLDDRLLRIPPPADRRLAVRLTPDALRHVRAGHPWVFDQSVTSVSHDAGPGDLAVVFDADRRFVALALHDPDSPIRFRIVHLGEPTPIDADFWHRGVERALGERRAFTTAPDAGQLAYRVINGENDGFPGLVVDRYADVLVVKLYSAVWLSHLVPVTRALLDVTGVGGVVLRLSRVVARADTHGLADGDVIAGTVPPGPVRFSEGGLWFDADVRAGQKTGHFLDQRANRIRVGEMASNRDVLDVFASTGGFSVHAAAGGARRVHAVDLSGPTLAAAERNMALNNHLDAVRRCRFTTEVGDAFEVMARLARDGEHFDLVVVDPPSFAQRQANVDGALRAYGRLTRLALPLLRPGGTLVQASCSSRVTADDFVRTVLDAAASAHREVHLTRRTEHAVDHPVGFEFGAYLKAVYLRVDA